MPVTSRPVKPWDYQRLLWNGSGLNSCETLVAQYLAWKARSDADEDGWFSVSQAGIAKACKLRKRDTVAKYLKSLVAKGWAQFSQPPPVDGHYQAGRYRITQPVRAHETGTGSMPTKRARPVPTKRAESAHETGNEVRSYFTKDVDDGAPPSGGGGDGQESPNQNQAPPAPALAGARTGGAEPEPASDTETFAAWDAEIEEQQLAELAAAVVQPKNCDPLSIACPEPDCHAEPGEPCPGYKLKGRPHSRRRLAVYTLQAAS